MTYFFYYIKGDLNLIPVVGFEIFQGKINVHGALTFRSTRANTRLVKYLVISLAGDIFTMVERNFVPP